MTSENELPLTEYELRGLFTQQQVAAFCGVSTAAVRKWDLEPYDKIGRHVYYSGAAIKAFIEMRAFRRGLLDAVNKRPYHISDQPDQPLES